MDFSLSDISLSSIFAGFVFGVIGLYLLRAGKKYANVWHIVLGFTLMVYPYLVSGAWMTWAMGIVLVFVLVIESGSRTRTRTKTNEFGFPGVITLFTSAGRHGFMLKTTK